MTGAEQQDLFADPAASGAMFDAARRYRYRLWRRWSDGPLIVWMMLNPSTADERDPDPTLTRCRNFSAQWGFGSLEIVNVYAFRSAHPKDLWTIDDPVGPLNDKIIENAFRRADKLMLGWGNNAKSHDVARVCAIMNRVGIEPFCLKITEQGQPWHPLYLAADTEPIVWPIP